MINLRDLIYGTQESADDSQAVVEETPLEPLRWVRSNSLHHASLTTFIHSFSGHMDLSTQIDRESSILSHRYTGPRCRRKHFCPLVTWMVPRCALSSLQIRFVIFQMTSLIHHFFQLLSENKDIPHFLTEHPSYYRFPQEEKRIPALRRDTLRNLWDQACYGGDFNSAMKVT